MTTKSFLEIDIYNRDRKSGHACSVIEGAGWDLWSTPKGRKAYKKKSNRLIRRQHKRIIQEALITHKEILQDQYEELFQWEDWYVEYDDDWKIDEDYAHEDRSQYDLLYGATSPYDEEYPDDGLYDDWCYQSSYDDYYLSKTRPEEPEDRIIKPEDAGKNLGEILQEILDRKAKVYD